jgi:LAS superfamily LD-carboxypeptidase LdcB
MGYIPGKKNEHMEIDRLYESISSFSFKKNILKEGTKLSDLPNNVKSAITQIEKTYNVKITDENIKNEFKQEGQIYPDNGKIDNVAFESIKKLLDELYKNFPDAPKNTNSNCGNLPGCVSGYRGYNTQAETFGGKVKEVGGVTQRQKSVALPGFSQHSTGKTFDILSVESDWWERNKKIKDWVANNCGRFGFKISYPTQGILRIQEPWHLYYIGNTETVENKKEDKTEKKNTTVSKQVCSTSSPCSQFGDNVSGCMDNLKPIGIGDHKLIPDATDAFLTMLDDMEKEIKVGKKNIKVNSSYRPLKRQCEMFDWAFFSKTGKRRKLGTGNIAIAYPGTSNHGWGRAVDISGANTQKWIKDNGYKYGWCWGEVTSEPWHFTFCGPGKNRSGRCDSFCKGPISKVSFTSKNEDKKPEEKKPEEKKSEEKKPEEKKSEEKSKPATTDFCQCLRNEKNTTGQFKFLEAGKKCDSSKSDEQILTLAKTCLESEEQKNKKTGMNILGWLLREEKFSKNTERINQIIKKVL